MAHSTITITGSFVDDTGAAASGTVAFKSLDDWLVNGGDIALSNTVTSAITSGTMASTTLLQNEGGYQVTVSIGSAQVTFPISGTVSQNLNAVDTGLASGDVAASAPNWKSIASGDLSAGVYTIGATDWSRGLDVTVSCTIRVPASLTYRPVPIRNNGSTISVKVDGPSVTLDLPATYNTLTTRYATATVFPMGVDHWSGEGFESHT